MDPLCDAKKAFKEIPKSKHLFYYRQFQFLGANSYFNDIRYLSDLMSTISIDTVDLGNVFAFDELLYGYKVSPEILKWALKNGKFLLFTFLETSSKWLASILSEHYS